MDGARSIEEDSEGMVTVVPGAGETGAGRSSVRGEPELEVAGEDGAYCRGSEPSAEEGREVVSGEDGGERVSPVKSEVSRGGSCGVNIVQEKKGGGDEQDTEYYKEVRRGLDLYILLRRSGAVAG